MVYNLAAGPVGADYDGDGFLDTAYLGDLGGNVWRFKFCLKSDGTSCNTTNWTGSLLFSKPSTTTLSIYSGASYTTDQYQNFWVYVGTGDKTNPLETSTVNRVYAIKDSDRSTTYNIGNLMDISSSVYDPTSTTYHGWYINLPGTGEKLFSAPVVYDQKIYFTTYTPTNNPCDQNGYAKLYIINYLTGQGLITAGSNTGYTGSGTAGGVRWESIGQGTPSGAVISINPYGGSPSTNPDGTSTTISSYDVYVSTSAPTYDSSGTLITDAPHSIKEGDTSPTYFRLKNMIYWLDRRVQ
jgi:type IV pilus assembly protein PilY1